MAIVPRFTELLIVVNPTKELPWRPPSSIMPWMFAPWPEARCRGVIEIEVEGETLRALVTQVSERYGQAGIEFEPFSHGTNDIDWDFEVLVNGKRHEVLPRGLDTNLSDNDEVEIKLAWRWDG
ncbi:MoaD/ThiS family protein [Chloroflexota bacterium]